MSGEVHVNGSNVPSPKPAQRAKGRLTAKAKETFLEAVAAGWTDTAAAELAGPSRRRFFALRTDDEQFADAYSEAREQGIERLEDELRRRGVEGFDEETFGADGKLIRRVRKTDTTALVRRLQALSPERYRDNRLELTGRGGGPIKTESRGVSLTAVVFDVLHGAGALPQHVIEAADKLGMPKQLSAGPREPGDASAISADVFKVLRDAGAFGSLPPELAAAAEQFAATAEDAPTTPADAAGGAPGRGVSTG